MAERYDAIIIGAGIIGAAIGLELARAGRKTLNVDLHPAAGYGSTSGSCAIIRTHYSTLDGSALAHEGYFYWKDWARYLDIADERGLAEFRETGCLVLKTEENGRLAQIAAHMDALGIPYEHWDGKEILNRLPHYDLRRFAPPRRPDDEGFGIANGGMIEGGIFFHRAGYISDPQLATHNLATAAEAAGGRFRYNARVVAIAKRPAGRVAGVVLDGGERIDAPVVVNAAGPHSAKVNAIAGAAGDMNITTRALKQEVVHLPAPVPEWDKVGVITSDGDVACYTRPETGGFLLIGSEDPPCDPREWVDADDYDANFSEQWRVQALRMAQRIPSLGIPSAMRGVVDLYDVSDDWIPIYDQSSVPGYFMAIGTSGNQFKSAPVVGAMMAALIDACEFGLDHDHDPLSFHLKHTGRDIDVGFYSRLRRANPESSFSVLG